MVFQGLKQKGRPEIVISLCSFQYCFYLFISLFTYLFWLPWVFAAECRLSLVVESRGCSLIVVHRLTAVASLVAEHRPEGTWASVLRHVGSRTGIQQLWHMGLVAPRHMESSQTRDHFPCIGRRILTHWGTRKVSILLLKSPGKSVL